MLAKLDAELSCHACQFKLENVSRIGSVQRKNLTVFLEISHFSGGKIILIIFHIRVL
jgi:hypothetical protein